MGYILITGGQMENKGAQAMVFTVVNEMKARYPEKDIILLSVSSKKVEISQQGKYTFTMLNVNKKVKVELLGGVYNLLSKFIRSSPSEHEKKKIIEILTSTDMILDISGYALSSQFNLGSSFNYIANIILAKKYQIPIYLLPQSFGPFNYKGIYKYIIPILLKVYLKYPTYIFAREAEGFNYLRDYTGDNLKKSVDIVLQGCNTYEINRIFKEGCYKKELAIEVAHGGSVAIIPNVKTIKHGAEKSIYQMYQQIIDYLLKNNRTVYLLRHSAEDLDICKNIKQDYSDESRVILVEKEFDCIEVHDIIKQFDFIIASRYHSIVHAYKNGIPALVFGWATKYKELLKLFEQDEYLFDVRNLNNREDIIIKLDLIMREKDKEQNIIKSKIKEINRKNIFADIFGSEH